MRLVVAGVPEAVATAATAETLAPGSSTMVRYSLLVPRQVHDVYQTATTTARLTDLLTVDGVPVDTIVADDNGQLPATQLPDGLVVDGVWLDPRDTSAARFFLPVRIGPATVAATTVPRQAAGTPAGFAPLTQADGSIAYQALPNNTSTSAVTAVDF